MMDSEILEELLPVFLPVAAYWISSGFYSILVNSKDEYRLFPDGSEEIQNLVSPKQVLVGVLVNQTIQMAIAATHFTFLRKVMGIGMDRQQASPLQIIWQIAVAILIMDVWEYFWHRWTHENRFLFKHVHSMHHHLMVPYAYGGQYNHVVDAFVGQHLGNLVTLLITGMSPQTAAFFFSLLAVKAVDDHCSRWFPESNPFHRFLDNNTAFHAVHHQLHGFKYNYSVHFLTTWDLLLSTYLPYSVEERKGGGYEICTAKDD